MSKSIHIYGFHSVEAQLNSNPECILNVFVQTGRSDSRMSEMTSFLSTQKINFSIINKTKLDRLSKGELHQGIVAEVILPPLQGHKALIDFVTKLSSIPLILMLDSIQDPRNLGACLRSANAAGVDCVVVNKDGSAPINAVVHKTSVGAINKLKIFQVTNLARTIKSLQALELWVIGLDGDATTSIYEINFIDPTVVVMGTEGKGLRQLTKKTCDQLAQIPMIGNIESLNVSVATGITLFEARRQRQSNKN
jgi:23S rRNA (guanosine2251-2'-O)-methyltransferase